jgi:hypothetical protein
MVGPANALTLAPSQARLRLPPFATFTQPLRCLIRSIMSWRHSGTGWGHTATPTCSGRTRELPDDAAQ